MTIEDQLRNLIDLAPAHIQRHFACDCAERALKMAKVEDERSWLAVEVSRRYAEGKATDEELDAARSAAGYAAWSAARYTASSAAGYAERQWQLAHLQSMISNHNEARSSLLYILQQRAESIKPIFAQYTHDLEERIFE